MTVAPVLAVVSGQGAATLDKLKLRPIWLVMGKLIVWFDGGCPLCRREIALLQRLDRRGRIDFVDLERPEAACPIDRGALLQRFHAEENGRLVSGAEAFAAMWRAIPILRPFGLLARNRVVLKALEWAYIRFLRIRPRLQRWVAGMERSHKDAR